MVGGTITVVLKAPNNASSYEHPGVIEVTIDTKAGEYRFEDSTKRINHYPFVMVGMFHIDGQVRLEVA